VFGNSQATRFGVRAACPVPDGAGLALRHAKGLGELADEDSTPQPASSELAKTRRNPDMLMKQQGLSEQKRELPWPTLKIKSLKSKQLTSLGCFRGGAKKKMLRMKVDPEISMKTKD